MTIMGTAVGGPPSAGVQTATPNTGHIGGVLGLILAVNALYVSFADVANANFRRVILPLGQPRA